MIPLVSEKTSHFTESVIREMTRLCLKHHGKDGINLAQGFPDFPTPKEMKDAACKAIQNNINQYAITWGSSKLRNAIAEHTKKITTLLSIRKLKLPFVAAQQKQCFLLFWQ